ncbi:hypothetical protein LTR37_007372 [Vermiconidia calcicola]|uniref:Uncharacterized protein n=1 Tax=Vermiconidia calcicola TaxID=1690605 RepID=A0ACC3NE31_9PEZI|nr:hypothetical protein LTR37_007372 [Vermiconidia calcicola]
MGILDRIGDSSHSGGVAGALFVLALTVAGLYGVDLHGASKNNGGVDGRWVFAEVVAVLSIVTVIVYALPFIKSYWGFAWDWMLFILWTALFGLFGSIYIPAKAKGPRKDGLTRMKHAVWVDLINMLLWFVTAIYSTLIWFRGRKTRTTHTGRAKV